ncbi:Microtubule-associated protein RP/EB family member 1B [Hibiscus syriacus]|uniref:Microtubule-associated protein RP/EB family member 1B n=1 Tax=Hibiscus syriacus TaxID=106335 RepID=A0A6A2ZUW2_HIBSY|nr:Microtubule-associated protein RP/EB family member 1B [Hibiscus syriacus]
MATNIGMMDSAYFVGRNEILTWINSRLQAASGDVQCQMIDMTYPGAVPMHKVNFDAKAEYDMIQNYKISSHMIPVTLSLQHIEVNRLVKGRPLDNLEFLQWLKRYCDSVNGGIMNENYDPVERRFKVGKDENLKAARSKSLEAINLHNSAPGDAACLNKNSVYKRGKSGVAAASSEAKEIITFELFLAFFIIYSPIFITFTDLKLSVDLLEKEGDFYFAKLRDIEILCQTPQMENHSVRVPV